MTSPDRYIEAAADALGFWEIEARSIEVIWRSENVTCRVESGDGVRHVLRLHRPGYSSAAELRSEVVWVESLAASGLAVASSVPGSDGGHHTQVAVDGEPHFVSFVEWVEGEPMVHALHRGEHDVVGWYREVGRIAATIRAHSLDWQPPPWFERRRWDLDGLLGGQPLWGRFWDSPSLDAGQRATLRSARDELGRELQSIGTGPSDFGLIHADLHMGNLMVHDGALTVIDFDDAGFGYFAHELGVSLHALLDTEWFEPGRAALIEGFLAEAPDGEAVVAALDAFLTIRCLMLISWLDDRTTLAEYERRDEVGSRAVAAAEAYLEGR